jgi:hypothetical protein
MYPFGAEGRAESSRFGWGQGAPEPLRVARMAGATRTSRASLVAPTVDRNQLVPEMRPEPVVVKTGFNCVVLSRIGGVPFRVVLDTGAARSLVRSSFAEQSASTPGGRHQGAPVCYDHHGHADRARSP